MTTHHKRPTDCLADIAGKPDFAHVRIDVVAQLLDCSTRTVQTRVNAGIIPAPKKHGALKVWRLGDLRRALA